MTKNTQGLHWWLGGKESACQRRRCRFNPWIGKIPWRRKWKPTPVFLPWECNGQRSLAGYNPRGCKESATTEVTSFFHFPPGKPQGVVGCPLNRGRGYLFPAASLAWPIHINYMPGFWKHLSLRDPCLNSLLLLLLSRFSRVQLFCDPIEGSSPGSTVPGILQAKTLERVAISFSNAGKWKEKMKLLSRVPLEVTPWTAAHQSPPSMGFSWQEYWSGMPLPSP